MSSDKIKLYIGSLPFDTRSEELQEMFSKYGTVQNGKFIFQFLSQFHELLDLKKSHNFTKQLELLIKITS